MNLFLKFKLKFKDLAMKEAYLHQVWKLKRFPTHQLKLVDGRSIELLDTGWHNQESGPDFFNGSFLLDGIIWRGNIELHVRSSDWYAHNHQSDPAYENVILHVVFEHDREVFIHDQCIPTLELKPLLQGKLWEKFDLMQQNKWVIPCANLLNEVPDLIRWNEIENASIRRLDRKANWLNQRYIQLGRDKWRLQLEILAAAFGNKINSIPFVELTQAMQKNALWNQRIDLPESLTLGLAGFLSIESSDPFVVQLQRDWRYFQRKNSLGEMPSSSWKFFGLRPPGFPPFRLMQFGQIIRQQDLFLWKESLFFSPKQLAKNWNKTFINIHSFWETHYQLGKETKKHSVHLSSSFQELIWINALLPYLWWEADQTKDLELKQQVLLWLQQLQPEKNTITQKMQALGFPVDSALASQGALELYNEFCQKKSCLSCKIGTFILGK